MRASGMAIDESLIAFVSKIVSNKILKSAFESTEYKNFFLYWMCWDLSFNGVWKCLPKFYPIREFWTKNPISENWASVISGQKIQTIFQNVFWFFVHKWRSLTFPNLFFSKNPRNWIQSFTLDFLSKNDPSSIPRIAKKFSNSNWDIFFIINCKFWSDVISFVIYSCIWNPPSHFGWF